MTLYLTKAPGYKNIYLFFLCYWFSFTYFFLQFKKIIRPYKQWTMWYLWFQLYAVMLVFLKSDFILFITYLFTPVFILRERTLNKSLMNIYGVLIYFRCLMHGENYCFFSCWIDKHWQFNISPTLARGWKTHNLDKNIEGPYYCI